MGKLKKSIDEKIDKLLTKYNYFFCYSIMLSTKCILNVFLVITFQGTVFEKEENHTSLIPLSIFLPPRLIDYVHER